MTDDFLQVSEREVGELRQQMLAFTRLQLANDFAAEDIVQEALAGALKNAASVAVTILSTDCVINNLRINEGNR